MITALYVREDSIYKELGIDCYDINRDARTFPGGNPVIAHPPCRAWGKLKGFAKPRHDEKELARLAIKVIRENGGVLEHPYGSTLFKELFLPRPGYYDYVGGYTIELDQYHFGHDAAKKTWVYIYGCPVDRLPLIPKKDGIPKCMISSNKKLRSGEIGHRPCISKKKREATPVEFAKWLIKVAEACA